MFNRFATLKLPMTFATTGIDRSVVLEAAKMEELLLRIEVVGGDPAEAMKSAKSAWEKSESRHSLYDFVQHEYEKMVSDA